MSSRPAKMNPFPGLRPFTQEEDYLFFGREEQTLELLQRLGSNRFVAVVGTSGSGKSSLVRCGLLSELLGGRMLGAGSSWEIAVTHPGGNPLALLTDSLLEADLYDRREEHARENLLATLSRSHFGLVEAVKQADLGEGTNFLLVVDQFEEIFRFQDAGQRQQEVANEFVSLLLEAVAQTEVPIYVVLTMRSDFIGECGQFEGLAEMVNRGEFLIPRLTREQYKRVIEGPIKVAGGQMAPRLLQRLLNDLGQQADQLPCLQHAMMRTWDVWAKKKGSGLIDRDGQEGASHQLDRTPSSALDLDDYQRVGRMAEALSLHADEIFGSLASDRQRDLCQRIFQALTVEESNSRGIRRPQRLGRLCQILEVPADELLPIIDAYRQSGVTFLMPSPDVELTDQTIIDISHESLMRVWTRLRLWVEEETQAAGIYHRLSESADLHQRGKAGLYRDPELGIALAWREAKQPNAAWAERYRPGFATAIGFLEASQQASVAEEQAREAARQRELAQAQQLAEAQQLRLGLQQRAARKLRKMIGGLAVVALVAGLACVAALVANKRANDQTQLASQEADRAEKSAAEAQQAERKTAEALATVESQNEEVVASLAKAETAGNEAREAAKQARAAEELGRRLLYATDMQLAPFIWNDSQATVAQLRNRLDAHDPETNKSLAGKDDLRGFEWHYYKHLLENGSTVFRAGTAAITDFALADDGLVTLDQQSRLKHWDPDTRLEKASSNPGLLTPFVGVKALSPNGQQLAQATGKTVQVLNSKTGVISYRFESTGISTNLIFSQDGRFLVTHDGKRAEWYDAANGQAIAEFDQAIADFDVGSPGLSLSADGLTLAVWGQGNTVNRISILRLDPTAKKVIPQVEVLETGGSMRTAALSPDGKLIAVGSTFLGTITVYDIATRQKIAGHRSAHATAVSAIAFSRNSVELVTADVEGVIKTWGDARKLTSNSEPQRTLKGHAAAVNKVDFSATGNQLFSASQDGTVRLWSLEQSPTAPRRLESSDVDPVFFAGGLHIATAEGNRVTIRDAATGQRLRSLADGGGQILSLAISPDNRLLAVGRYAELGPLPPNRVSFLSFWEIDTGRRVAEFFMDVVGGVDHYAYTDLETLAFSPNGKFLVAGFGDRSSHFTWANIDLKVWDVANRRELKRLVGHSNACVSICFSPDGMRMASGSHDGTARVWDTATWQAVGAPFTAGDPENRANSVEALAFSPDGRTLAMGTMGGSILLWDLATRDGDALPKAHANSVNCVTFSPDGRTLASGSSDETIRLWNLATSRELMVLNSKDLNLVQVRSLSFSPDGTQLLAGSAAGSVVWSATPSIWDNPPLAAKQFEPLLRSPADFQIQVQMSSDIPRLHEALETLNPKDLHVQAALAATRANWHAAHGRWNEAAKDYDRLKELVHDGPQAWLRTPGLIRVATALFREGRPAEAATLLTGGAKRRAQDGLPSITETDDPETGDLCRPLLAEIVKELAGDPHDTELLELRAELAGQWSGFADQVRDYTVVIDKLTTQPLEKVEADLQRVYRRRGNAYFGLKQWQKAVDDFTRVVTAQAGDPELLSRRAKSFEELRNWPAASTNWTQALETNPDAGRIHAEFAARLTNASQSELAASHRKQSQKVFEAELARDPENSALAAELADQLLNDTGVWTLLKPTEVQSTGGATLTRLPDGSILASGENPLGDAYTIAAETVVRQVHAIRLEALTHESLPKEGPGRDDGRDRGNFAMVNFAVTAHVPEGESKRIDIKRVIADHHIFELSTNHWNIGGGVSKPHVAVYLPSQPLDCQNGARLEFQMHFSANTEWPGQNLGRFRLWVSSDPAAFDSEQQRIAALKLTDPWAKLAAAYYVLDDQSTVERLFNQHPIAASGIGDLFAVRLNWERAISEYSKAITAGATDARTFAARAEAYEKLERWELAAADWGRVDELLTDKTRRFQNRFSIVRRADLYDRLRQLDKALADYTRAVELPNAGLDPFLWRKEHWAKRARWAEAIDDYRQVWNKREPSWYTEWYYSRERAILNLISGDSDDYRHAVSELLTRTEKLTDSDSSTWLVYTLVAGPDTISAETLARLTAAADRTDSHWKPKLKAAIHFRRGEFQQAADLLDQHGGHPGFEFLAAMAHLQLQHPDRARQLFQLAGSWIQQQRDNDPGCGSGVPRNHWWGEWAIVLQLQREAARQLDGQPLTELDARLKTEPKDAVLRLQRGRRLADLGLPDEALADLAQIASAEASSVEFFSVRGRVLANLNLADEALADLNRAIDGKTLDALVYAARGKILLDRGQVKPARADLEKSLQLKPTEEAAGSLAELLLADNAGWTVLTPTEMKSEGGVTLTLQPDGSVLASGANPDQDLYRIIATPGARDIFALRLEALPDSSLSNSGPGRSGNFVLTELEVVHQERAAQISGALETYAQGADFTAAQAIDSNPGTGWAIWKQEGHAHSAYFRLQSPIRVADVEPISFILQFAANIRHTLGRFRLSVSDDSATFEYESKRLAALKLADPWARLAAAYVLASDTDRAADLLAKSMEKHGIAAWFANSLLIDDVLDSLQSRHPDFYATLLPDAASAAVERGQMDQARTLYDRLVKLQPENGLWIERTGQLRPGVLAAWNFDTDPAQWRSAHNCKLAVKDGVLTVQTTGDDPNLTAAISGPVGGKAIVLRYRTDEALTLQVFWADSSGALDDSRHLDYPIPASSGEWAEITLPFWCQGILNTLRLDPNTASEHPLEIDSIVLQNLESTEAWSSDAWMRIIQQQPGMTQTAFDFFRQNERWAEAAPVGLKLIEQNPEDTLVWLRIAPLLALTDDSTVYSEFCGRMVQQFSDSKLPETTERVIKASLLRADAIDLAKLPRDLLAKSLDDGTVPDWLPPWGWGTRALLACRSGDAESAVKYVAKSEEYKPIDVAHALNLAVLAMAQHQVGKAGEAKTALEEASQLITRLKGDPGRKSDHDLLIAEILLHEAEALMNGKVQPKESGSEEK